MGYFFNQVVQVFSYIYIAYTQMFTAGTNWVLIIIIMKKVITYLSMCTIYIIFYDIIYLYLYTIYLYLCIVLFNNG